jgi:hypothetical protein
MSSRCVNASGRQQVHARRVHASEKCSDTLHRATGSGHSGPPTPCGRACRRRRRPRSRRDAWSVRKRPRAPQPAALCGPSSAREHVRHVDAPGEVCERLEQAVLGADARQTRSAAFGRDAVERRGTSPASRGPRRERSPRAPACRRRSGQRRIGRRVERRARPCAAFETVRSAAPSKPLHAPWPLRWRPFRPRNPSANATRRDRRRCRDAPWSHRCERTARRLRRGCRAHDSNRSTLLAAGAALD